MTTTYVRLTDTDKPESQTAITASFVDENGKHIDIGGGGTAAGTLTEDNLEFKNNVTLSGVTPVGVCKNSDGNLSVMFANGYGLSKEILSGGVEVLTVPAISAVAATISTLDSSAELTDVINKVNEILNAVKNAH